MDRKLTSYLEIARRREWPHKTRGGSRVGVVTVSYNTKHLTAGLLYTLHRVLPKGALERIVVVDNGSTDGSVEMLEPLAAAGLIELVKNRWPTTHGPGLNRGMNRLARHGDVDLVWVLDSDVFVLRSDALSDAVEFLDERGSALIGQAKPGGEYAHVSSNLLDPAQVWRRPIPPFWDDGEPGARMQREMRQRGRRIDLFPFYRSAYLLHIGGGTLRQVAERADGDSPYWEWATDPQTSTAHYHGNERGPQLVDQVLLRLTEDAGGLDGDRFVGACVREERFVLA